MKRNLKSKNIIPDSNHQLLSIKELMDTLLKETEGLPQEVKQAIIQARDTSWQAFIKDQEKSMSS